MKRRRNGPQRKPRVLYSTRKMVEDMAAKGWTSKDLARFAGVSEPSVSRFLTTDYQAISMATKLARALGFSPARYLIRDAA